MKTLHWHLAITPITLLLIVFLAGCEPGRRTVVSAAMGGDLNALKALEARGQSLDSQDIKVFNWPPLTAAIFHEQTNIIAYLLTKNVNLNLQDRDGKTPLMWAIEVDDTNTVRLLLEKGADTSIKDRYGATVFGYAEGSNNRDVVSKWLNEYKK